MADNGNLKCMACDYDLRGTAQDGACPECGCSVERTLREQKKPMPTWLRLLNAGALAAISGCWMLDLSLYQSGPMRLYRPGWMLYWQTSTWLFWVALCVTGGASCALLLSQDARQSKLLWLIAVASVLYAIWQASWHAPL